MGTWRKMSKTDHNSDRDAEKNKQSRSQQQLKYTENQKDIAKNTRFPDGKVEKNEQSKSQQPMKITENYRDIIKYKLPRWERGEI